ncbi:MAG: hypothetical protein R3E56_04925 [Burkholderiaceae bacterium]
MGWHSAQVSRALTDMSAAVDPKRRSALRGAHRRRAASRTAGDTGDLKYQHSTTASARLTNVSVDPLERSYRISRMGWAA